MFELLWLHRYIPLVRIIFWLPRNINFGAYEGCQVPPYFHIADYLSNGQSVYMSCD